MNILSISSLSVSVGEKKILRSFSLDVEQGKTHVIMGPNGSGKSTLASVIAGSPVFTVEKGVIMFNGCDVTQLTADERAKKGVFIAFQYPKEIPGVLVSTFLRTSYLSVKNAQDESFSNPSVIRFNKLLKEKMDFLEMDHSFLDRYMNKGFSGGEKKKLETLQMLMLEPELVILDEVDSGLDIDALQIVSKAVNYLKETNKTTFLVITHYQRILRHISPDVVHVMIDGLIKKTGGKDFAEELEAGGYKEYLT